MLWLVQTLWQLGDDEIKHIKAQVLKHENGQLKKLAAERNIVVEVMKETTTKIVSALARQVALHVVE